MYVCMYVCMQVLLVSSRSEPDKWTVAGGGVDPGETSLTTCVREAREEVREGGMKEGKKWEGARDRERGQGRRVKKGGERNH